MSDNALRQHANLINSLTIAKLRKVAKDLDYTIFDKGNYNLNIWGVRCDTTNTKEFNDFIIVFYKEPIDGLNEKMSGRWVIKVYSITTDPSDLNLINPINSKGCALLKEGQFKNAFKLGKHKNDYDALVQVRPLPLYRINTKDGKISISGRYEFEMAGINIHRASKWKLSRLIGLYSAGCQVFENVKEYENEFIPLIKKAVNLYGNSFTYTLINISDLF